jgi:Tfp pilus assembly protein PilP
MELSVEVGGDGQPAYASPPSPPPAGQGTEYNYAQPEIGYASPAPGQAPYGAAPAPGQDPYGTAQPAFVAPGEYAAPPPLPTVPADAPPPVPPSLPAQTPPEPDPEPKTPEEAAAQEAKNMTFEKLAEWHATIMAGYVFNTSLMNDPFMPIESVARPPERALVDQQDEERRKRLPLLQRLALNQFTLSAIVVSANPEATSALLDSGGRSFIVHRGTMIGPNGGFVKEITTNRVIVVEPQVNYRGETQMAETVFRMNTLEDESLEDFKLEQGFGG